MKRFRQGDTVIMLINFDESIGDQTLLATVHDTYGRRVWKAELGNGIISLGNNVYRTEMPHTITKGLVGKYYYDLLIKSPNDTSYVNVGDKHVEMVFKEAKIINEIAEE